MTPRPLERAITSATTESTGWVAPTIASTSTALGSRTIELATKRNLATTRC
jgi:hypothetical protein